MGESFLAGLIGLEVELQALVPVETAVLGDPQQGIEAAVVDVDGNLLKGPGSGPARVTQPSCLPQVAQEHRQEHRERQRRGFGSAQTY